MCPNPIVHVPIRNRIVQVQSEQAASRGVVRISTHKSGYCCRHECCTPIAHRRNK